MVTDIRHLRIRGEKIVPEYDKSEPYFTLEIHHKGKFEDSGDVRCYKGGIIDYFDYCNIELMSLLEVDDMLEILGYEGRLESYFRMGGVTEDWVKIYSDSQLLALLNNEYSKRILSIPIYIDHPCLYQTKPPSKSTKSPSKSTKSPSKCNKTPSKTTKSPSKPKRPQSKSKAKVSSTKPSQKSIDTLIDEPIDTPFDIPAAATCKTPNAPTYTASNAATSTPSNAPSIVIDVPVYDSVYVPIEEAYEEPVEGQNLEDEDSDDSTELSHFSESDYEDDDKLFDESIDIDAEWAGLKERIVGQNVEVQFEDDHVCTHKDCCSYEEAVVEADYPHSDSLSMSDSSDEEGLMKRKRWPEFNKITDMDKPVFTLGMLFPSTDLLAEAIRKYAIKQMKQVQIKKKCKASLRAICDPPCPWVLYASRLQNEQTVQIKTLRDEHTCGRSYNNRNITSNVLAKHYCNQIRLHPKWPIESFQAQVLADLKVNVSAAQCYRAKEKALSMSDGSLKEQYAMLHDYVAELKRSNPGSTVVIQGDKGDCSRFGRIYICFAAMKKGMRENCRPLVGLDGCHLKGQAGGILLAAVGVDGNNGLYPISYAVVESENKDSWSWFITLVKDDIGVVNTYGWTWMTDKQKGLLPAIDELCENSEQRHCLRHLYSNFKLLHKGLALKDAMYDAAKATTVPEFNDKMEELKKLHSPAFDWLAAKPPAKWSKSHFQTFVKSDMLLNNICESFNKMILDARSKPIISMLERIRIRLMKRIHVNKAKMMKNPGLLCTKIEKILDKIKDEACHCIPDYSGEGKFEVDGPGGKFVCDLNGMICVCRKWDLTGIPCKHAMSALNYSGLPVEPFVHKCYYKSNYLQCYSNFIQPLNGPQMWSKTGLPPLLPPVYAIKPGQTQGKRRPEPDEKQGKKGKGKQQQDTEAENNEVQNPVQKLSKKHQVSLKCSNCGSLGHNKRSCKAPVNPNIVAKKKPSKPRKQKATATTTESEGQAATKRQKLPTKRAKKDSVAYMGNAGAQFTMESQPNQSQSQASQHTTVMQSQLSQSDSIGPIMRAFGMVSGNKVFVTTKSASGSAGGSGSGSGNANRPAT